jgi:hypothetical protein
MIFNRGDTTSTDSNTQQPGEEPQHHQGSAGEDDDVVHQLGNTCAQRYFQLEECLAEHDRDWSKCQREVKALQNCSATATSDSEDEKGRTRE